jgi:type IX secretion system PorP/SprF family membrane protein
MIRPFISNIFNLLYNLRIQFVICIYCLVISNTIKAQQEPMYSQYMFNMVQINPAYAGNRAINNITSIYRKQWIGIKGAPTTASLSWDARAQESNVGYGLQIYNDQLGIESTTGFQAFYSYRIAFNNSSLSLGLSAGILNYRAGYSDVQTEAGDPLFSADINRLLPTAGIGALYASEHWYAGLSIPALLTTKVNILNYQITSANNHYFLTGGYIFDLSDVVRLKPSFLLKAVKGSPFQYDLNLNTWIQNTVGLGVSYRLKDAFVGVFEIQITPDFGLGYAYDYTLSPLKSFRKGTHELMIRYEFTHNPNKKMFSPRYY